MIEKIISGGQWGADYAGLVAGKKLKLETGGTAPLKWRSDYFDPRSLDGTNPKLKEFGLVESSKWEYPARTLNNVSNSDGTVIYGKVSAGTGLTQRYCEQKSKPFIWNPKPSELAKWIFDKQIKVLNVAGNRESKSPGIEKMVEKNIIKAFKLLNTPLF